MNGKPDPWHHQSVDITVVLGALVFAAWFGIAGSTKIDDPSAFRAALASHGMFPDSVIPWVSTGVSALKMGLAGLLIISIQRVRWLRWSGLVVISVMASLCAYLTFLSVVGRGGVNCGCSQSTEHSIYDALVIDLGVLVCIVPAWWYLLRRPSEWRA